MAAAQSIELPDAGGIRRDEKKLGPPYSVDACSALRESTSASLDRQIPNGERSCLSPFLLRRK